ncbi:MAG: DinB family protein [Anaerolineales bacterium]
MTEPTDVHESAHLARRLKEEGLRTVAFFQSLAAEDWDQSVYPGGSGWRVRDVLAHFVSAEGAYLRFLRDTLSGGPGLPKDFDIDAFNAAEVPGLSTRPPEELLDSYREIRAQTAALAASLSPEDLLRDGYHPWFGIMKIAWYLRLCYNHNSIHLRDVRRSLAAVDPPADTPPERGP